MAWRKTELRHNDQPLCTSTTAPALLSPLHPLLLSTISLLNHYCYKRGHQWPPLISSKGLHCLYMFHPLTTLDQNPGDSSHGSWWPSNFEKQTSCQTRIKSNFCFEQFSLFVLPETAVCDIAQTFVCSSPVMHSNWPLSCDCDVKQRSDELMCFGWVF